MYNMYMDHTQQTLAHEGVLIEYAHGYYSPADLASTPGLRAKLIAGILPTQATPIGLTACWIHTGWWPRDRLPRLFAARSTQPHPDVVRRIDLPDEYTVILGGQRVPSLARTATDLLLIEEEDIAIEACLALTRVGLTGDSLVSHIAYEHGRRGLPHARKIALALRDYLNTRAC